MVQLVTLLHSERPKLHAIVAFLSAVELKGTVWSYWSKFSSLREGRCLTEESRQRVTKVAFLYNNGRKIRKCTYTVFLRL